MKKTTVKLITASAASIVLVSALCIGSYAALKESGTVASDEYIGYEKAKEIVLSHAGVSAENVWFEDIDTDREKGILVYEIEFHSNGVEYEYKVDAATGNLLKSKADRNDRNDDYPSTDHLPIADDSYISPDEAKSIALLHAGVEAENAWFESCEFDYDDGRAIYELEFYYDGVEYDYDVDAVTSAILKSKQEGKRTAATSVPTSTANSAPTPPIDESAVSTPATGVVAPPSNDAPAVPESPRISEVPATPTYIGIHQAKQIALDHAGVNTEDVRFTDSELDIDDGRATYELEFCSGVYEYEYEIDALTGKILECNKEYDD